MDSSARTHEMAATSPLRVETRDSESAHPSARSTRFRQLPSAPSTSSRTLRDLAGVQQLLPLLVRKIDELERRLGDANQQINTLGQAMNNQFIQLHTIVASAIQSNTATLDNVRQQANTIEETVAELKKQQDATTEMQQKLLMLTIKDMAARGLIKISQDSSGGEDD